MALEVEVLKEALESYAPESEAGKALTLAVRDMLDRLQLVDDLNEIPDEELLAADHAQLARLSYVSGYLRILGYLRKPQEDARSAQFQAKLALDFVKHTESTQLQALQLGRKGGDSKLESRVRELRAELDALAEAKAEAMVEEAEDAEYAEEG